MPSIERFWVATLTHDTRDSGTDDRLVVVVNQNGRDFVHETIPDTQQRDLERGQANLYEFDGPSAVSVSSGELGNSSIRVGLRGSDLWRPQHIFVWGQASEPVAIVEPLGIETNIDTTLSADPNEGNLSLPLRRASRGLSTTSIRWLLVAMTTANIADAGTDDRIQLTTTIDGLRHVYQIDDTSQDDQERSQANLYFLRVDPPFRRTDLTNGGTMTIRIRGNDMWIPGSLFVFGLDQLSWPYTIVPLVHEPTWSPSNRLSTDGSEGVADFELQVQGL